MLFALSSIIYTKLILAVESEATASNYLYCAAIIMSILTLQELGIINHLNTYIYTKKHTNTGSVLMLYFILQIVLTTIATLGLVYFDSKIELSTWGILLLSYSLLVSKKAWGFAYSVGIKSSRIILIFGIALCSPIVPLLLLLSGVVITYELVTCIMLLYFLIAIILVWPFHSINLRLGAFELITLMKEVKKSAIMFNISNLVSFCLIFADRRLIFSLGGDFGQVIMSISLIALNVGTLISSGVLKIVWRDQINLSKTILNFFRRHPIVGGVSVLIFITTSVGLMMMIFEIPLSKNNLIFMYLITMGMPFMILIQLISVEQYAVGRYDIISRVSLSSLLIHLLLISIMTVYSSKFVLEHVALKWFLIYFITSSFLVYRFAKS